MKNKTVLQELLEWIDSSECRSLDDVGWEIQVKIKELLPKEKEQLKDAFFKGNTGAVKKDFNKYFNITYGE